MRSASAGSDYRHHDKTKVMTLAADEFIRRFLLHTLPDGFHRIRHYGFLANGHRAAKLALCRHLLEDTDLAAGCTCRRLSGTLSPADRAVARHLPRLRREADATRPTAARLRAIDPKAMRHLMTGMQLSSHDYKKPLSVASARKHRPARARATLCVWDGTVWRSWPIIAESAVAVAAKPHRLLVSRIRTRELSASCCAPGCPQSP